MSRIMEEKQFEIFDRLVTQIAAKIESEPATTQDLIAIMMLALYDVRTRVLHIEGMVEARYRDEVEKYST